MIILDSGAEAIIKKEDSDIIKERISKSYRIPEIDSALRKSRTRREAKVLEKLSDLNFPSPKVKLMDDKNMLIRMDFIKGDKLRDVLYKDPLNLGREIGCKIGTLHANDIIHGDLTTSNMILNKEVTFIDFGLSFFSNKVEDKAVDLHLFRQALESKHHTFWEECFEQFLEGYSETCGNYEETLKRFSDVELRGRNKH